MKKGSQGKMMYAKIVMKNIYLIQLVLVFIACSSTESSNSVNNEEPVKLESLTIQNSSQEKKSKFSIDTLVDYVQFHKKDSLIRKVVYEGDIINKYNDVKSCFDMTNIDSFEYFTFNSSVLKEDKSGNYLNSPGLILCLSFASKNDLMNSYTNFKNDLLKSKLNGKMILKSGSLIFTNNLQLYVVHVASCSDTKKLNQYEEFVRHYVFENAEINGLRIECGMNNYRTL